MDEVKVDSTVALVWSSVCNTVWAWPKRWLIQRRITDWQGMCLQVTLSQTIRPTCWYQIPWPYHHAYIMHISHLATSPSRLKKKKNAISYLLKQEMCVKGLGWGCSSLSFVVNYWLQLLQLQSSADGLQTKEGGQRDKGGRAQGLMATTDDIEQHSVLW